MESTERCRDTFFSASAEISFPLRWSRATLFHFASAAGARSDTPYSIPLQQLFSGTNRPSFLNSQKNHPPTPAHSAERRTTSIHDGNSHAVIPTVLVVEDDPDISMALRDLLEFEGFRVDCAETCRQAFASLEQRVYDIVLLDLGLPDGDGASILEKLQETHPSLPVIVLTATNRDLGALHPYALLTKPWQRAELCRLVHQAIDAMPDSSTD